jgi:hypothetical protein
VLFYVNIFRFEIEEAADKYNNFLEVFSLSGNTTFGQSESREIVSLNVYHES